MDKEIVKMYSENDNIDICIEECGELIHALSKYKRSKGYGYLTKTPRDKAYIDLVQAVADCINAIESVSYKMELNKSDIVFEVAKADAKARRNIYGETEEENEDTLASVKRYWFKKALKKDEEKQEEIAKNEFHSEKCSIKNNDAYPVYRLEEREEQPLKFKIGDIELGAAALSMVEPHKSGDINQNIDIISPAKEDKMNDAVNHPSHYCRDGIECIDVIKATTKGLSAFDAFCQGNAMKYLFRWQFKNGAEDLKKARWYIDKLLEQWDGQVNNKGD